MTQTQTHTFKVVVVEANMLITPSQWAFFFGCVTHDVVPNLNLMLGVCNCVCDPEERCFHSDSSLDFFLADFYAYLLKAEHCIRCTSPGVQLQRGKICTLQIFFSLFVFFCCSFFCLRGTPIISLFVLYRANNQRISIVVGKASDICLTYHLIWIRAVLDSWEGHTFVYSNWQRF